MKYYVIRLDSGFVQDGIEFKPRITLIAGFCYEIDALHYMKSCCFDTAVGTYRIVSPDELERMELK